jgi:Fic-DOC domain mobile mystery protein B
MTNELRPYSFADVDGETPLEEDDLQGLIPTFVATRGDLNQVEAENILRATPWALERAAQLGPLGLLQVAFLFQLHRRMFSDVWDWAGSKRLRETNLGSDPAQIDEEVKRTLDDVSYWDRNGVFDADGRAIRLHHRLVTIHPFRNGNGGCTRLIADLYLLALGSSPFAWGGGSPEIRARYIEAVRSAPADDYAALLDLARRPHISHL